MAEEFLPLPKPIDNFLRAIYNNKIVMDCIFFAGLGLIFYGLILWYLCPLDTLSCAQQGGVVYPFTTDINSFAFTIVVVGVAVALIKNLVIKK